jgi:hypothetical protein
MCVKGENLSKLDGGFKPNLPVRPAVIPDGRSGGKSVDPVPAPDPLESGLFLPEVPP